MRRLIVVQPHRPDPEPVEPIEIESDRLVTVEDHIGTININGAPGLDVRQSYEFAGKAIYLNLNFDWVLGKDSDGSTCLVPLKLKTMSRSV